MPLTWCTTVRVHCERCALTRTPFGKPPCADRSTRGCAPRRWLSGGARRTSLKRGARPPRRALPSYRSTTPASQQYLSGCTTDQSCLTCWHRGRRPQHPTPPMVASQNALTATGCASSRAPVPAARALGIWRALSCLPQHLHDAAVLYEAQCLAGKAPHAAYLAAFCSAPGSALLLSIMEHALAVCCAAEAPPPASGAGPASAGKKTRPDARG